jgi:hypothetical protein
MRVRVACAIVLAALASGSSATAARGPVPQSLQAVESAAEDLVDAALSHDRGEVVAGAAHLRATVTGAAGRALVAAGVSRAEVAELARRTLRVRATAGRGSFVSVALAANAVSELMPQVYARFHDRVPPLVQQLDYLDRQAQLEALAGRPVKVAAAVHALGPVWTRLRARVVAAGGSEEAAAYTQHVHALSRLDPKRSAVVAAEAVHGQDLVDRIESVFTR